jgi:hypothetical protein
MVIPILISGFAYPKNKVQKHNLGILLSIILIATQVTKPEELTDQAIFILGQWEEICHLKKHWIIPDYLASIIKERLTMDDLQCLTKLQNTLYFFLEGKNNEYFFMSKDLEQMAMKQKHWLILIQQYPFLKAAGSMRDIAYLNITLEQILYRV